MGRKLWVVLLFLALTTAGSLQFSVLEPPNREMVATSDDDTQHSFIPLDRPTGEKGCGSLSPRAAIPNPKGAITSKIKHTIKLKTSPARLVQLLHTVRRHWLQAKTKC